MKVKWDWDQPEATIVSLSKCLPMLATSCTKQPKGHSFLKCLLHCDCSLASNNNNMGSHYETLLAWGCSSACWALLHRQTRLGLEAKQAASSKCSWPASRKIIALWALLHHSMVTLCPHQRSWYAHADCTKHIKPFSKWIAELQSQPAHQPTSHQPTSPLSKLQPVAEPAGSLGREHLERLSPLLTLGIFHRPKKEFKLHRHFIMCFRLVGHFGRSDRPAQTQSVPESAAVTAGSNRTACWT